MPAKRVGVIIIGVCPPRAILNSLDETPIRLHDNSKHGN